MEARITVLLESWKGHSCVKKRAMLWCFSYVGNLDPAVTEELIIALFSPIGQVKSCKIISEVSEANGWHRWIFMVITLTDVVDLCEAIFRH